MALVSSSLDNLLNGVSQQPPRLRLPSQSAAETNTLAVRGEGLLKRPPTEHVAALDTSSPPDDAFVHVVSYSEDERYVIILTEDGVQAFDAEDGASCTVLTPEGYDYFAGPSDVAELTDDFSGPDESGEAELSDHIPVGEADDFTWALGTYTSPLSEIYLDEELPEAYIPNAPTSGSFPQQCVGVASLSPSSADYTVEVDATFAVFIQPSTRTHIYGVTARGAASGGSCYRAYANTAAGGTITLDRINATGVVQVTDSEAFTWTEAQQFTIALRCTGDLIEALVDGVVVLSMTDSTLTAAGKVGLIGNRSADFGAEFVSFNDFRVTVAPTVDAGAPTFGSQVRALTIQDTTVLVNRGTEVTKGAGTSDIRPPEALIYIRQADYETTYSVVINDATYSYATASTSRAAIATDFIAEELLGVLTDAGLATEYTMAQYGSSIHITRIDEADFTIGTKDGLADAGLIVIKGKAQRFSDLPAVALDGFLVEITGDPGTEADNYWVQYNDADTADRQGIWVETLKPGRLTSLDATTLPHVLVRNGSVVPEFENGPTPKPPIVRPYGSGGVQKVGFENAFWDIDIAPSSGNNVHELRDDAAVAYANLKTATGLPTEFTLTYAVTTEDMDAANALTVTVRYNASQGSTSWTSAGSKRYEGNNHDYTDSIVFTAAIGADCDVSVLLTYDTTPIDSGFTDERGEIRLPGDEASVAGLQFTAPTDVDVIFDADEIYPVGYTVTLDVDAASPTYTVATAPMTGAELATALEVEVEAVADISSAVADTATVRITRTTSGLPAVALDTAEPAFATHCWQEDATLTVDALVGMTVENVTDGSVGVIGDNGTSYISTSALTGGSTNRFNPGDLIRVIDTDNLPYFVFRAADWSERIVGDDDSNPFPSFTGATIDEVFFTQGRLGFTSGANVVLSQADDLFNFFRSTVTALRDSDNIDLTSTGSLERFHGVVSWNEEVLLFAEKGQYRLDGGSGLSPRTASLPNVGKYESSPNVRPVVIGSSVFFPSQHGAYTWMSEMRVAQDGLRTIAQPITTEVPRYLLGGPLLLTGTAGVLVALTDDDRSTLFAYCYSDEPDGRVMGGWRTWQFAPGCSILGVDVLGPSTLVLVIKYSDGLYLETLDLSRREDGSLAFPVHLDRRVTPASRTLDVDEDEAVVTDFDLPYPVAVDGSEGTVGLTLQATGAPLTVTRPTTTTARVTGTYAASDVWAGLRYSFLYRLSTLFLRRQNVPINDGRLDLRWLTVVFTRTRSFLFRVTQLGRTDKTRQYSSTSLLTSFADESERYPVQGRTEDVVLSLEDSTSEPLCLTALDWEGNYTSRSQRV